MRLTFRSTLFFVAVLLLAGVALLIPFFKASPESLKTQFNAEVQALMGEKATAKSAHLALFPSPHLILNDVKIGENEWLKAEKLTIKIGVLGLWSKSLSKNSLEFTKATLDDVTLSDKGFERLKLLMQLESSPLFGKIMFLDSEMTLKIFDQEVTLTDFDGEISFEKTTSPFKIKGNAFHGNEKYDFAVQVDRPQAAFIPTQTSPLTARIVGKNSEINLKSDASLINGLSFHGTLSLKKDDVTLTAKSDYSAKRLTLNAISLKGKGLEGEGTLSFEPLSNKFFGTLFFKQLTHQTALDASNTPSITALQDTLPLTNKLLPQAIIDLRISVEKLSIFNTTYENVSGVLIGNTNEIKLSPLVFQQQGGTFKGDAILAKNALKITLQGQNVQFLPLFPAMKIEGKGDIALQFLINEHTFPYQTDVKFALKDGSAHYGNLEERLLEAIRRPLSRSNITITRGTTKFQSLKGQISFDATKWAITEPLTLETARFTAFIEGGGENDKLSLKGLSRLKALGVEMPYNVTGLIKEPRLSFTPQDIINRSQATKPLREGARDENAMNAVRDIMNRQTPNLAPLEAPHLPLPLKLP